MVIISVSELLNKILLKVSFFLWVLNKGGDVDLSRIWFTRTQYMFFADCSAINGRTYPITDQSLSCKWRLPRLVVYLPWSSSMVRNKLMVEKIVVLNISTFYLQVLKDRCTDLAQLYLYKAIYWVRLHNDCTDWHVHLIIRFRFTDINSIFV